MAQHVADLVERRSFAEHVGSETVAQQMRADVLLRRLQAGLPERVLQHGVYDLGILERPMVRRPRRDEQRTRVAGSSVSDVIHDRFAHVRGKRHAVVQLALAPDEDLARAPVDVVELDRDNLGRAKSEPRHEQQHRVVAPPNGVVGANRLDQPLDLFGLEIARQMVGAGGDARQAVGEIAPGLAAPEQELEQTAQMRRQRFVAAGLRSGFKLAQESDDIVRRDRVQVAELVAEAKGYEPLQEARAVSDRGLGQSALSAQVGLIFVAEAVQRRRLFRRRFRDSRYTGFAQMFDEPSQAELGIACVRCR